MKIIIACEKSQEVCKAFRLLGHEAFSNDIQDCSGGHPEWHLKMDAKDAIKLEKWDMLIGFPPCTYLTYAGIRYWNNPGRAKKRLKAISFFLTLWESKIKKICLENPQGIISQFLRKPDQVIHPYYFGDKHMKRTCIWLKNLPKLTYQLQDDLFGKKTSEDKPVPIQIQICKKTGKIKYRHFTDSICYNKFLSSEDRSKTFPGIAKAMAEQWG